MARDSLAHGAHFDGVFVNVVTHAPAGGGVELIDMAGRRVATLEDRESGAGTWRVAWSSRDVGAESIPPGVYFVRLRAGERVVGERKVAVLR